MIVTKYHNYLAIISYLLELFAKIIVWGKSKCFYR